MQTFKTKSPKLLRVVVAAAISIASYQSAQATPLSVTARVRSVDISDLTQNPSPNSFTLVGVSSLGNCVPFLGIVYFRMKDDLHGQQMYAMALAAAASGSSLIVNVDDTYRDAGGNCYVTNMAIFAGN